MQRTLNLITLFFLALALAGAALPVLSPALMRRLFVSGSYYLLLILFFYWLLALWQYVKNEGAALGESLRQNRTGLLLCLLLCLLIFISVPPFFRVLSDEATLMSASQSMVLDQTAQVTTSGANYGFAFRPLDRLIPRRPLLFPFFIHLFHSATGYRIANVFALNFLILFSLLSLIFVSIAKHFSKPAAVAAVLLVAAQPLVIESATSGGFDLFAAFMFLLCLALLWHFLNQPGSVRFHLLWVHLLLLAHTRYESLLFFALFTGLLALWKQIRKDYLRHSLLFALTPLLLTPLLWQRFLAETPYAEIEVTPFSAAFFLRHSRIFFELLFDTKISPVLLSFVNFLGIAGLINFVYLFSSRRWPQAPEARRWALTGILGFGLMWVILTAYYFGSVMRSDTARYYTLFFILFSVSAVLTLDRFGFFKRWAMRIPIAALLIYLASHAIALQKGVTNQLDLPRRYRYALNFLENYPKKEILLITDRPVHYTVREMAAISFPIAVKYRGKILNDLENRLYREALVIQEIDTRTRRPTEVTNLGGAFELEPLFEIQNSDHIFIRISKVKTA